ncbi:T9SS type A sorting domain-containing protein [Rurimicrobium arvi]|uniref:Por secretion system C-terminal sorting domain-containing protein n=1 Tax=Rurimicrobium arvi TaxID=2049916 RepID=A0ABP8MS73_9BACT
MKKVVLLAALWSVAIQASAQISILDTDMPVSGDTLRYSITGPSTVFSAADSGTAKSWDFSSLGVTAQAVDTYKKASAVNLSYALTISSSAYGYKVADSIPGLSSFAAITAKDVYTFFNKKSTPSRFIAEAFAANLSGIPTPANYSDEDEIYFLPLNYGRTDSSTYLLNFSIAGTIGIKQAGYRITRADGWGTIKTPYFTTATPCLRIRQEIHEVDSINILGSSVGLPRTTVDYKFLVSGEHYPAVWVTATVIGGSETVNTIRYRDTKRIATSVPSYTEGIKTLQISPNPSGGKDRVQLQLPVSWKQYTVEIYDMQGRLLIRNESENILSLETFASGSYIVRVLCGSECAYGLLQHH